MTGTGAADQVARPKHPFRPVAVERYERALAPTTPLMMPHRHPLIAVTATALMLMAILLWLSA
jgi:hypothetical protein